MGLSLYTEQTDCSGVVQVETRSGSNDEETHCLDDGVSKDAVVGGWYSSVPGDTFTSIDQEKRLHVHVHVHVATPGPGEKRVEERLGDAFMRGS